VAGRTSFQDFNIFRHNITGAKPLSAFCRVFILFFDF
jgi:hypothetical protein